jgi:hypothetical protein
MVAFLIHFKKRKLSVGTCAPELGSPRKRACFSAMLAPATGPRATREVRRDPRQPRGPSYRNETRRLARRSRGTPSRLQRRQGLARPDQRRTPAKVAAPNSAGLPEDRRGVRIEQRWLTADLGCSRSFRWANLAASAPRSMLGTAAIWLSSMLTRASGRDRTAMNVERGGRSVRVRGRWVELLRGVRRATSRRGSRERQRMVVAPAGRHDRVDGSLDLWPMDGERRVVRAGASVGCRAGDWISSSRRRPLSDN